MNDIRIGNGYDVHALGPGLPLMLGGVRVESPVGCIAHSDGDVAIHALCDALLGALALGDIGKHFPDTSDEFKGIDSKILLQRTMSGQGKRLRGMQCRHHHRHAAAQARPLYNGNARNPRPHNGHGHKPCVG